MTADPVVCVIDDDASVRRSLTRLLQSAAVPVRAFASAQEFLAEARAEVACCLVLDLRMPGMGGLDLQHQLRETGIDAGIVFLTGHGDVSSSVRAMKNGAVDFLEKPFEAEALLGAVRRALDRVRRTATQRQQRAEVDARVDALTPREREVLALVVSGLPNRLVARRLGIAEKTVKVHRGRVMEKMGVDSLADLVRMAAKVGIGGEPA
jgi:FixJ family two-component response regulator